EGMLALDERMNLPYDKTMSWFDFFMCVRDSHGLEGFLAGRGRPGRAGQAEPGRSQRFRPCRAAVRNRSSQPRVASERAVALRVACRLRLPPITCHARER